MNPPQVPLTPRSDVKASREPSDGPFCWQTKTALRSIRDAFDATGNVAAARSVYLALSEVASDQQSAVFTTTIAHLAKYAGLSARTVGPLIECLENLRLIFVRRNTIPGSKLKAPSTYELLPFGNGCVSISIDSTSMRNHSKQQPLPRHEESPEESLETTTTTDAEALIRKLQPKYPGLNVRSECDRFYDKARQTGHTPTAIGFQKWLAVARPRLKRTKPTKTTPSAALPQCSEVVDDAKRREQLEEFRSLRGQLRAGKQILK